jgi:hypothetical protein
MKDVVVYSIGDSTSIKLPEVTEDTTIRELIESIDSIKINDLIDYKINFMFKDSTLYLRIHRIN